MFRMFNNSLLLQSCLTVASLTTNSSQFFSRVHCGNIRRSRDSVYTRKGRFVMTEDWWTHYTPKSIIMLFGLIVITKCYAKIICS